MWGKNQIFLCKKVLSTRHDTSLEFGVLEFGVLEFGVWEFGVWSFGVWSFEFWSLEFWIWSFGAWRFGVSWLPQVPPWLPQCKSLKDPRPY